MANIISNLPKDFTEASATIEGKSISWAATDWSIGDPITEEKMDNTEIGLIIAFYKLNAILREISGKLSPEIADDIQINSSRIDELESNSLANKSGIGLLKTWITGLENGTYDGDSLISRLDSIENLNAQQSNKINNLENDKATIFNEVYGATLANPSRIDKLEAEILGNNGGYDNSRIDKLEKEVLGTGNGYDDSRIDKLENCCEKVKGVLGAVDDYDSSFNKPIIDKMNQYREEIDILYGLLANEIGKITKTTYYVPFTFSSADLLREHYMDLGIRLVDNDFVPYENISITCLGKNIWNNSYFTNNNISYDSETEIYSGSPANFSAAFNSFFNNKFGSTGAKGVKISFDFNFSDPLKVLKMVFNYGAEQVIDTRTYHLPEPGWQRISFVSHLKTNGEPYPVMGVNVFFYGDGTEQVELRNVQFEPSPANNYTEAMNPFEDNWIISLPEEIYGGYIDLIDRKIVSEYKYIQSYNGETITNEWHTPTGSLINGSPVVYKLEKPIIYKIAIKQTTVTQGFNIVPAERTDIKLEREYE